MKSGCNDDTRMLERTNATTNTFCQWNQDATTKNATTNTFCLWNQDATTNECHNDQFLSMKSGCYNEHGCYNERMMKRTVFINEIRMLQRKRMLRVQRTNATTNSFYQWNQDVNNEQFLSMKSGCYNEYGWYEYNERMLHRTVFINEIRMLTTNSFYQWNRDATTNTDDTSTTNECYNEHFLSMKSGC